MRRIRPKPHALGTSPILPVFSKIFSKIQNLLTQRLLRVYILMKYRECCRVTLSSATIGCVPLARIGFDWRWTVLRCVIAMILLTAAVLKGNYIFNSTETIPACFSTQNTRKTRTSTINIFREFRLFECFVLKKRFVVLLPCLKIFELFPLFVRIPYYDHETRKFIVPSRDAASREPVDPQRI